MTYVVTASLLVPFVRAQVVGTKGIHAGIEERMMPLHLCIAPATSCRWRGRQQTVWICVLEHSAPKPLWSVLEQLTPMNFKVLPVRMSDQDSRGRRHPLHSDLGFCPCNIYFQASL